VPFLPCTDCGKCVRKKAEYAYMVHKSIWLEAGGGIKWDGIILCIGCLEKRLKRRLVPDDFDMKILLNALDLWPKSTRLRSRYRHRPQGKKP
jgi:hypothetical protein